MASSADGEKQRRFALDDERFLRYQEAVLRAYAADKKKQRRRVEAFEAEADAAREGLKRAAREARRRDA